MSTHCRFVGAVKQKTLVRVGHLRVVGVGAGFSSQQKGNSCFRIQLHLLQETSNIFNADSPLAGRRGSPPPPATFHGRFPARTADAGPRAEQSVPALATASLPREAPRQGPALARRGGREGGPSSDSKGWAPGQLGGAQAPI